MPTINVQGRRKLWDTRGARNRLDSALRAICAPALSTPSYEVRPNKGLIININVTTQLDRKLDLYLEIEAFGAPDVEGRDGELIAAEIKAGLVDADPSLRFAGWIKVGAEKYWISSSMASPSVVEILAKRSETVLAMPISGLLAGGHNFASKSLHTRTWKCLARNGINTVGELVQKSEGDLLAINSFGERGLNIVKAKLAELDLKLRES